jgi:hypothetical protein
MAYSINGIIMICVFCNLVFCLKTFHQGLAVLCEQSPGNLLTQTMADVQPCAPMALFMSL